MRTGWTQLGRSLLGLCLLLCLLLGLPGVAIAAIHEYPEASGTVMLRSLQTLRDRRDQAWQLVLYKWLQGNQTKTLHLRMVGFPGETVVRHPAPLQISGSDRGALAADVLPADAGFPANVGEYDLLEFVPSLKSNAALHLGVPLATGEAELVIPPFVVKEWRHLVTLQKNDRPSF